MLPEQLRVQEPLTVPGTSVKKNTPLLVIYPRKQDARETGQTACADIRKICPFEPLFCPVIS